jgi:hypothetical protein
MNTLLISLSPFGKRKLGNLVRYRVLPVAYIYTLPLTLSDFIICALPRAGRTPTVLHGQRKRNLPGG